VGLSQENPTNNVHIAGISQVSKGVTNHVAYGTNWLALPGELNFIAQDPEVATVSINPVSGKAQLIDGIYTFSIFTNKNASKPASGLELSMRGDEGIQFKRLFQTYSTNTPMQVITNMALVGNDENGRHGVALYLTEIPQGSGQFWRTPAIDENTLKAFDTDKPYGKFLVPATNEIRINKNGSLFLSGPFYWGQNPHTTEKYLSRPGGLNSPKKGTQTSGSTYKVVD
jgi:hypothetical protein